MISEGAAAPGFELPALVDGERRPLALDEYLGEDVVILAFYPADFNPACDETSCDLDELDLFTMQKDVTILGISPDSVYSHRAFAERYDLSVPLLADTAGEVARRYDLAFVDDIGQRLLERAVAVVDHDGVVQYAWSTDDMTELPRVEEIKDAIADTGGDDTAFARYRVGHAHYTEGRRAFTSAMGSFGDSEWMLAQNDFQRAREEFAEAEARFDTAVRFVDDESLVPVYDGSRTKANALWQAADWLAQSASAYSSGSGGYGQELREDAERPLENARNYEEPPPPDEWPPAMADLEKTDEPSSSILPEKTERESAALDVDIDHEMDAADGADPTSAEAAHRADATTAETDETDEKSSNDPDGDATDGEADIDDTEIAEIQAEVAANNPETNYEDDEAADSAGVSERTADGAAGDDGTADDAAADRAAETSSDDPNGDSTDETPVDGELELTDPTSDDDA
ncbi:redoxin domain-containing protein [Haloarcula marina]|uniref:redoxin domain-containing protein n=1 Tax=Haloarcula marina TaxID=2961574 RepID=UPI0020B6563A|nr:redoxin domain-containing protein [Halomicroarcula marina]